MDIKFLPNIQRYVFNILLYPYPLLKKVNDSRSEKEAFCLFSLNREGVEVSISSDTLTSGIKNSI